jgi:hypothetical protein
MILQDYLNFVINIQGFACYVFEFLLTSNLMIIAILGKNVHYQKLGLALATAENARIVSSVTSFLHWFRC